ncbi:flagellar hook-basal body complex protein [Aliarcobacter butzleri]|uniref:flagellar hook-basal body complex protein n=1 Tax=Aliarcobacter butzleri TaxID=28197 RepID=UPI000DB1F310|nr:flagellar hook-basal body complex protein [Aliarcobacter butzleri]MCP3650388.1 flagellar hook-basal body complex protein [Arcobacter sp. DNRA7]MCG3652301.1 flagellar hook-basal body complex protein [Aliarcobacter butzleri]MCG3659178.1 flagellar hook-basal body complex protein [Aliarcobacter butzleri]MCG3670475.1 flagellar hook-basal body complex protein [Aliarcobacter butzleri]MCG3672616.1 flagellar hook-basal body complex protein [Aliarcobacter butzleri]
MIGALWTGVSGLASQTTAIDNESNNVANVNTVGYKASRISFADQIYQNQIGKGSYVQDAEKLFTQGSMKVTGVDYDVALQGDGFFTVINKNTLGTAETFYTRAGNLRMGDSGTLQTADGYEVQGWAMSSIDEKNDVISTNSNATRFTSAFTKNIGSAIIKHNDYIETIAAKTTNVDETTKSDSTAVFSGAGEKTKASKLKDIELATDNYNNLLTKYQEDPDASSKGSISQVSQVNFRTGVPPTSIIGKEGDSIKVVINGNTYTQPFVVTKSTETYRTDIWNSLDATERTLYGLVDPATISGLPAANQEVEIAKYDKIAGKIETYKAMADKISNSGSGGMVAYLAKNTSNPTSDVLDPNGTYEASTEISDMLQGIIQIKSLIPGTEFKISEVSETTTGTDTTVKGTYQSTATAVMGTGKAALEDARDALSRLVTGNQQSVYTTQDLYGDATAATSTREYKFSITIYDKDLGYDIPVPNDGNVPPNAVPIVINAGTGVTLDDIVTEINNQTTASGPQLGDYITAKNVNGYLVIETNDGNYDVEFDASLTYTDPTNPTTPVTDDTLIEVNPDYSGRKGAGAEFMEITTRVDQTSTQSSLQLRLDKLGISDSKFGSFSVDETGLITITEGGVQYAVGQVSIARFTNNQGLLAVGNNNFQATQESGKAIYSTNNNNTAGMQGKTLELSEADLSESLVNLMVFQRAFEANAKSITTADEMLTTLINLKR